MVKRLGCGSVWCGCGCGMAKGLALRDALKVELESFTSPYFITTTIDPDLFPEGPESALRWVQEGGVISEFVRSLRRRGHLLDGRYVSVMEFQENGWPHWHLIFDAEFVPFDEIAVAWAQAGWSGRAGVQRWGKRPEFKIGQRPVFGSVSFRKRGRESLGAICHYLTKYVTKMPVEGWPEWVLRSRRQLRRWSTSRDFWRVSAPPRPTAKLVTEFSKLREKYFDASEEWAEDDDFLRKIGKSKRTIGERLIECGEGSVVLEEVNVIESGASGPVPKWRWVGMVKAPVWRDPHLGDASTFKVLESADRTSFVVADPHGVGLVKLLCGLIDAPDVP